MLQKIFILELRAQPAEILERSGAGLHNYLIHISNFSGPTAFLHLNEIFDGVITFSIMTSKF